MRSSSGCCGTGVLWGHHGHRDRCLDPLLADGSGAQAMRAQRLCVGVPPEGVRRGDISARVTPSTTNSTRSAFPARSTRQRTRPLTCCPSETVWLRIFRRGCQSVASASRRRALRRRADPPLRRLPFRRPTWRRPEARACRASRAPRSRRRGRAPPVDGAPMSVHQEGHGGGLRAPRAHPQLHRSAHLRPGAGAGARQRKRLVVDDDRRAGDVVAAWPGDAIDLKHVRPVAEFRCVRPPRHCEGRTRVGRDDLPVDRELHAADVAGGLRAPGDDAA